MENYGKVIHLYNKVGGWVRIVAPCDGDLRITILARDINRASFQLPIHSNSRPGQVWPRFERSDRPQTYVFPDVKAGENVSWWAHQGNGWTYTDDFLMVVCFTGHHAGEACSVVTPATYTEPAREATMECPYCGGDSVETAPALGHAWGEAGVVRAATCTQEGVYGHSCKRCGEADAIYTLPPLGHEAAKPVVVREATCSNTGSSEVRCMRCETSLYTIDTPTTGHHAAQTRSGERYGTYVEYSLCECGYLMDVNRYGYCPHNNATLTDQLERNLYAMDVYCCEDCHAVFENIRPAGGSLFLLILSGVCLLLLAAALTLLVITLITALHPLRKQKGTQPAAPIAPPAAAPDRDPAAQFTEGRDE